MPFTFNLPEFESHGGHLEAFNDGHCPETFRCLQNENEEINVMTPRIVRYDHLHQSSSTQSKSSSPSSCVHIYDDVLHPNDTRMLYELTASDGQKCMRNDELAGESPWGAYVTTKEALEWIEWKKGDGQQYIQQSHTQNIDEYLVDWRQKMIHFLRWQKHREGTMDEQVVDIQDFHNQLDDMDYIRHALAIEAVASFFIELIPTQPGSVLFEANSSSIQSSRRTLFEAPSFLEQVHGVAVWALSSTAGQSVSYHIDYAELLRYEYNVTVPPLWAGTIQCSNLRNQVHNDNASVGENIMQGGEFCVNLRGLDHYAEHGYKGNISGDPNGGWERPEGDNAHDHCVKGDVHMMHDDQWVTIPYSFNRGIVHRGDLPHLSAPITSISTHENGIDGKSISSSRVIVGFNAFGHDVGALIAKAPEHSKPFRRKVRLYRSTINSCAAADGNTVGNSRKVQGGMDLSQIRQNKCLMKLLVLAKREKVKEELRRNQEQLSFQVWQRLLSHHQNYAQDNNTRSLLRVYDIVEEFGSPNDGVDGLWPKSIDVHVHLHHMLISTKPLLDGRIRNMFLDEDGIAGPPGVWYCVQAVLGSSASPLGIANSKTEEASPSNRLTPLSTHLHIVPTMT
jgi:hypothetical protein